MANIVFILHFGFESCYSKWAWTDVYLFVLDIFYMKNGCGLKGENTLVAFCVLADFATRQLWAHLCFHSCLSPNVSYWVSIKKNGNL